jgi:hypothetical protein
VAGLQHLHKKAVGVTVELHHKVEYLLLVLLTLAEVAEVVVMDQVVMLVVGILLLLVGVV